MHRQAPEAPKLQDSKATSPRAESAQTAISRCFHTAWTTPKLTQRANWAEVPFAFWLDPICTKEFRIGTEPYGLLYVKAAWPASARAGCTGRDRRPSPDLPQNGLPRLNGAPPGADEADKRDRADEADKRDDQREEV